MNAQSYVDAYQTYKECSMKSVAIKGNRYWKIIDKSKLNDFEVLILPKDILGRKLEDELGNLFHVSTPLMFSFKGEVPEWYQETVSVMLMDIEIKKLGEYVRVIDE